jgi:tetratricopeptide (TPR) repeat protein
LLFGALLALLPARAAHADDDATTGMARERFKEGVQYFDQKQYDKSRAAFLQAYALKRHPAVLLNLAQSELRSGHEADAAKHFSQYLREAKDATDSERQSAESGLTAAKAVVGEVSLSVDEEGAAIAVDGSSEGQSPLPGPLYLMPGSHTITAKKDSRDTAVQVTANAGQTTSASLRFKKGSAPPAAAEAEPAKEKQKEEKPAEPSATTSAKEESASPATSEPERHRKPFFQWATSSPIAMVGGAIAVAGIGSGIGFALASKHNYDNADSVASQIRAAVSEDAALLDAKRRLDPSVAPFSADSAGICGDTHKQAQTAHPGEYEYACKQYRDNVNTGDSFKTVSLVSWVVAGAAVAGTVIVYFVDGTESGESTSKKTSRATAAVVPWISGSERGLFVTGSF